MTLESKIEAVLFYKNEPLSIKALAKLLDSKEADILHALEKLSESLSGRGICVVQTDDTAGLVTSPDAKGLLENIAKDEMSASIGKAGLETLAIILYNGPVSRREIDYIRGVNSTFVLRNLAIRGLVDRENDPNDQRSLKYKGSLELYKHLGIKNKGELPGINDFKQKLEQSIENSKTQNSDE